MTPCEFDSLSDQRLDSLCVCTSNDDFYLCRCSTRCNSFFFALIKMIYVNLLILYSDGILHFIFTETPNIVSPILHLYTVH